MADDVSELKSILTALVEVETQRFGIETLIIEALGKIAERLSRIELRLGFVRYVAEIDEESPTPKPERPN